MCVKLRLPRYRINIDSSREGPGKIDKLAHVPGGERQLVKLDINAFHLLSS
jgi:hypothetical protein